MHTNIVPRITGGADRELNFDAHLTVGDATVAMKVELNDDGAVLTTKKDTVRLPRTKWLDVAVVGNSLTMIVDGFGYDLWAKKRKFEKKNPDQEFSDFDSKPSLYNLTFKPRKLPEDTTVSNLTEQTKRTYQLAYLDDIGDVQNPVVIECPDCKNAMDVTPWEPDDNTVCRRRNLCGFAVFCFKPANHACITPQLPSAHCRLGVKMPPSSNPSQMLT